MPTIELLNTDCMEYMKGLPDKAFDLAIVDPPYGVGNFTQSDRKSKYGDYTWNEQIPNAEYFAELRRVSLHQIIWGANYYNCFHHTGGAIIWDKHNPHPSMSRCEIASTTTQKKVDYVSIPHYGFVGEHDNFHPCGKPVRLYRWVIEKYAKAGWKILDTHLGSGSSAIAAHQMGFDFVGCEIDKDYYDAACKRFKEQTMQQDLFKAS